MKYKIVTLLLLSISTTIHAEQRLTIQSDQPTTGYVSLKGLNRIAIEGDRILSIKGLNGQFQMDKDAKLGQIFLQPILVNKSERIHLFMTTEKGHTYSLNLLTHDLAPETIILLPPSTAETEPPEKTHSYELQIVNLIKAMHHQLPLEGYSVDRVNKPKNRIHGLAVVHLESFLGAKMQGECLQVHNDTPNEIFLSDKHFVQAKTLAVAVQNAVLKPGAKFHVYLVKDYGVSHE